MIVQYLRGKTAREKLGRPPEETAAQWWRRYLKACDHDPAAAADMRHKHPKREDLK